MKSALHLFVSFSVIGLFFLILLVKPAFAQTTLSTNLDADVPQNTHTWVQTVMIEVLSAGSCQITGVDPTQEDQKCLGINPTTHKIGYIPNTGGALGMLSGMIAFTYTPPIHTGDYFNHVANNFGIVKHAYAADSACTSGIGFCGLLPLLNLWIAFRNLVFLLFVLVFILVGLAIMLRIEIDPRTVTSIENSVPKIIIALILVSFSFAIAGFIIDMMYVSIFVVFNFFSDPNLLPKDSHALLIQQISNTQASLNGSNPFQVLQHLYEEPSSNGLPSAGNLLYYQRIIVDTAGGVKDIVYNIFTTSSTYDPAQATTQSASSSILSYVPKIIGGILFPPSLLFTTEWGKNILGGFLGYFAGALAFLIVGIVILIAMFRLWFALISAYIYLLIDVVLAPFFIVAGVFPGSPISFDIWLRDMIANCSAFVVTIGMFLMGRIFMDAFSHATGPIFAPPLIGNPTVGAAAIPVVGAHLSQGGFSPFASIIGVGIIWMTPGVVNMMKELLKAPTFKYASEAFKSLGAGQQVVGGVMGTSAGALQAYQHGTAPVLPGGAGLSHYFFGRAAQAGGH